jgi:23S rRNA pseudouridine2605 synthase
MEIRLQRYLSMAGVAARRKAEGIITAGRVKVNGKVVTTLGTKVDPDNDFVTVDCKEVRPEDPFYVVLNKPKGCITAVSDDRGRRTVMEYLPNLPVKVAPVGRLDYYSEGVLLLTNDGELSAALQSPQKHVEKTYHVKVRGEIEDRHIEAWCRGIKLDDGRRTRPAKVERLKSDSRHTWLAITLTEGRSRQIHRMAEAFGYQVIKLQRVAFGGLSFHGLRIGDARELTQDEVNALRKLVDLPGHDRAVARGTWTVRREQSDRKRRIGNMARREREGGTWTKKKRGKKKRR